MFMLFTVSPPEPNVEIVSGAGPAHVLPAVLPLILVNSQLVRHENMLGETGHEQCDVPARGNHRIGAIEIALPGPVLVCVHVGDNFESGLAAELPEGAVARAVEDDDARIKAVRVEVIIVDEAPDASFSVVFAA
jgi:hypothetical protein